MFAGWTEQYTIAAILGIIAMTVVIGLVIRATYRRSRKLSVEIVRGDGRYELPVSGLAEREIARAETLGIAAGFQDYVDEVSAGMGRPFEDEGRRITDQVERIEYLKRKGAHEDAIGFLLAEIDREEADSRSIRDWGVAPWYYWQAAVTYRKMGRIDDEIALLKRFARQKHSPGVRVEKLLERLEKAKALAEKRRPDKGAARSPGRKKSTSS